MPRKKKSDGGGVRDTGDSYLFDPDTIFAAAKDAQKLKELAAIKSGITYQQSRQRSGMGIGAQHNGVSHLTECSSWDYPENDIELVYGKALGGHPVRAVLRRHEDLDEQRSRPAE